MARICIPSLSILLLPLNEDICMFLAFYAHSCMSDMHITLNPQTSGIELSANKQLYASHKFQK